ncbi:MAG: GH3 auxin-responsive promoter family protein [Planctomycetota bacterium]
MTQPSAKAITQSIKQTGPTRWTAGVGLALRAQTAGRRKLLSNRRHWTENTAGLQRSQLRQLLWKARDTEIGKEAKFEAIAKRPDEDLIKAYNDALPVTDWYGFQERLVRMREQGQPDVLWPGLVKHFAQTSGTTAGDKFIPITKEMFVSNRRAAMDIFAHLGRKDAGWGLSLPKLTSGKMLFLGGSAETTINEHGVHTGDLSGLVTPMIKWPLSAVYAPGAEIALIGDWTTKINRMAEAVIDADVRFISGMPSWAIVLFNRLLELARERGRNVKTINELWPNLTVFVHGGVKYTPFIPRVNNLLFGDESKDFPTRLELYPASEGFIALQDTAGDPGLRLLTDIGNYYEFVPVDEVNSDNPRTFTAWQVEPGVRYVVCMTTCSGLWRYLIGDVVEFDTVPAPAHDAVQPHHGPARLRIVGRHRHFINAFGENVIVEHVENAVAQAASQTNVTVGEFTACPVYPGEGRRAGMELAVEIAAGRESLQAFTAAFDDAMKTQNVDYTTKRNDDLGMAPPTVTPLPVGAFHNWMAANGKLGGQHKCPRCANDRNILEAVVAQALADNPPDFQPA